ncbi:acyltransferase [Flavobacterium silvisoli]|uniref:Acyltransferase n=1 Tax=Flavobacterium silvisoli TaxID=2529433 RepID=A0A4Q9Z2C1_9FLAO|nr:acyltransferase [Flavobacterium silvisoli]TBX70453.1 acyltransferase [Flavobacterium silvisoli]
MTGNQKESRVFGLDLMRAMAISLVVFGHCVWIFPESNGLFHQLMVLSGFLGVEVFFVLSGFLIGKILYQLYLKEPYSIKTVSYFLKRRWFRTLPNYYLILLINIGVGTIVGYPLYALWKYFFFLQNLNTTMLAFFPESWSLSVEEFAYVILPVFLLLLSLIIKPKNKSRFFVFSVSVLLLFFFCTKIYYQYTTANTSLTQWNTSLKAVVIYRLDSIFIGVLCSWIYLNFTSFWQKNKFVFFVLGTLIFLFQFVGIGYFRLLIESHPVFWNVFYLPLGSIAVACFLPFLSDWKEERAVWSKPIVFVSLISYSVYLLHYSVVLQLLKYFISYDAQKPLELYGFVAAYVGITFGLSYLLHRFYEKPIMDLRDKN